MVLIQENQCGIKKAQLFVLFHIIFQGVSISILNFSSRRGWGGQEGGRCRSGPHSNQFSPRFFRSPHGDNDIPWNLLKSFKSGANAIFKVIAVFYDHWSYFWPDQNHYVFDNIIDVLDFFTQQFTFSLVLFTNFMSAEARVPRHTLAVSKRATLGI